jgi:hypothetical protein
MNNAHAAHILDLTVVRDGPRSERTAFDRRSQSKFGFGVKFA